MGKSVTKRRCDKGIFLASRPVNRKTKDTGSPNEAAFLVCDRPPGHYGPHRQLKVRGGFEGDIISESKRTFLVRWNETSN